MTSIPHTGAAGTVETPHPTGEQDHGAARRGSGLLAALGRLGRGLSRLVRWAAGRLPAPVRRLTRLFWLGRVAKRLSAPLRWSGRLLTGERGFGFWWLLATLGVALALGMVVGLLLTPVAGLIALLVVVIWALVRRRRRTRSPGTSSVAGSPRLLGG